MKSTVLVIFLPVWDLRFGIAVDQQELDFVTRSGLRFRVNIIQLKHVLRLLQSIFDKIIFFTIKFVLFRCPKFV